MSLPDVDAKDAARGGIGYLEGRSVILSLVNVLKQELVDMISDKGKRYKLSSRRFSSRTEIIRSSLK